MQIMLICSRNSNGIFLRELFVLNRRLISTHFPTSLNLNYRTIPSTTTNRPLPKFNNKIVTNKSLFIRFISQRKADIKVKKVKENSIVPPSANDDVVSQLKNIQVTPHHYSPAIQRDGSDKGIGNSKISYYIYKLFGDSVTPQTKAFVTAIISVIYWILAMLTIICIFNIATNQGLFIPTFLTSKIPLQYADGVTKEDIESLHEIVKDALISKLMLNLDVNSRYGSPIVIKGVRQLKAELHNPKGYVKGFVIDLHCFPPIFQRKYKERDSIIDLESLFQPLTATTDSDSSQPSDFQILEKPSEVYRKYTIKINGSVALKRPRGSKLRQGFINFEGSVDLDHTKYVNFDAVSLVYREEDGHFKEIDLW